MNVSGTQAGGASANGNGFLYGSIGVTGSLKAMASGTATTSSASLAFTLSVPGSTGESYVSDWSGVAVVYTLGGGKGSPFQLVRSQTDMVSGVPWFNSAGSFTHASSGVDQINEVVSVRIPVSFGVASSFSFLGKASASVNTSDPKVAGSGSALADFGHTFQWLGTSKVTYLNARGIEQPLESFSINSASGIDYRSAVAAVPEPESCAMLLAGIGLIGGLARRRNKTLQPSRQY
jgi:hypothetical protein